MWQRVNLQHALPILWLLVALLATSAIASPTVVLEQTSTKQLPPGWIFHGNASASDRIKLFIALRETKMGELKNKLFQRCDSDNHKHLTQSEVNKYRQPDRAVLNAVSSWLKSNGVKTHKVYGSWVSFEASAQTVKTLFQADLAYYAFEDIPSNDPDMDGTQPTRQQTPPSKPILRALSYTVPTVLSNEIDFVHPLTHFMTPRSHHNNHHLNHLESLRHRRALNPSTPPSSPPRESEADMPCLTGTFPECIRTLYNITYSPSSPSPPSNSTSSPPPPLSPVRFGIAGFLEQWIMYQDVATFLSTYTPEIPLSQYNFSVTLFNNAINPQDSIHNAGMEASLDVEYAMALGYPTNVTYYITGGRGLKLDQNGTAIPETDSDNEPYLEFLQELLAKPDEEIPHVLSISYADDEKGIPLAYAQRVCDMFAALTARGVSILAATGDGGAAGTAQTQCVRNDGSGRKAFVPTFPASCPYVTAVGATENIGPPLTGADFSTGGFSDYFARPEWQEGVVGGVVERMVKGEDERLEWVNVSGRAIPDISAVGTGFQVQFGGRMLEVLGTSASTPVVAAMVALVNDARMRDGKASLGWLNPRLYGEEVRGVLRDVVHGDSLGCYFPGESRSVGWPALKGYDLVTGLGTVGDFHDLLGVLVKG